MKSGRASRTAEMVCLGRALASERRELPGFSDPTALALLPPEAKRQFEALRGGTAPKGLRQGFERGRAEMMARLMAVRTVAIDEAIRQAAAPQLVILGAGLDGRAWRMPELADVIVYEIDHPDSQRAKRERAAGLVQMAREVRFVPVDFAADSLDAALASAGHDSNLPTTWVWEGVVMYLARPAIESTLEVVRGRSLHGSRLAVLYHSPALILRLVGLGTRLVGEPLRSAFTAAQMRDLLAAHGFSVGSDLDLPTIAGTQSPSLARALRVVRHMRLAIADNRG